LKAAFFLLLLTIGAAALPIPSVSQVVSRPLSKASVLGYLPYQNPKGAAWYLSHFSSDFNSFFYEDIPVGDSKDLSVVNSLASKYPNVTFMVQFVIPPSVDLYNGTQLREAEQELKGSILDLNQSNERCVEIEAMGGGSWSLDWSTPTRAEEASWSAWLAERGLPKVPYGPVNTVYEPLFSQWAVNSSASIAAQLINFSRSVRPGLEYGLCQYDSIAQDSNSSSSLYTFVKIARPNFVLTMNLALAVPAKGFTSYPYVFVLLTLPMDPSYYKALDAQLMVSDSFAAITSSSDDTTGMSVYKFTLNELSTYLSGATPIINMAFADPSGNYVNQQEFVLDPALQLSSLPSPSIERATVLVIRPTFSLGYQNWTAYYQQELFYSLTVLGIPFDYASEAYVYSNPSILQNYKYIIYASTQVTPQMLYILSQDKQSTKIGLSSMIPGYIYSPLPGSYNASGAFTHLIANFSVNTLSSVFGKKPNDYYTLYFGNNELSWADQSNYSGIFLDGNRITVQETDYLGLLKGAITMAQIAWILAGSGVAVLVASLYYGRHRKRKLEKLLEEERAS